MRLFYLIWLFQSTLPARGSDVFALNAYIYRLISIHAPRKGERQFYPAQFFAQKSFQSTLPARGSDDNILILSKASNISIHAPRKGERPKSIYATFPMCMISIHAPRKGERRNASPSERNLSRISIHAPRKGERHAIARPQKAAFGFQSTLPARGSDEQEIGHMNMLHDFNPRSPQGGATLYVECILQHTNGFQSTLPARGSDWHKTLYR